MPLWLETQRLVAECRRILARLSANTCLEGRCFAVEKEFYARMNLFFVEAGGGEAMTTKYGEALFENTKRNVGYEACMEAAVDGLRLAYPAASTQGMPPLVRDERYETQAFALRCVGIMATAPGGCQGFERRFAKRLRALLDGNYLEQPFKGELIRAWDRPALQDALRARGVFEKGDATINKQIGDTIEKKMAADLAKYGLRWCSLPSCAKQEGCVFDFKACSACKAVVYCSTEHGALHWTQGHRKECAVLKAAGAKPRSTADEGEGGAGAA